MKSRRSFIAAVASGGVAVSLSRGDAVAAGARPSSASLATAASMRRFDRGLTDGELQTIAKAIDANVDAAKALNPKGKPLRNGDAPGVRFSVADVEA